MLPGIVEMQMTGEMQMNMAACVGFCELINDVDPDYRTVRLTLWGHVPLHQQARAARVDDRANTEHSSVTHSR